MPDFDELHHHVEALNALLEDRNEGTATWCLMAGGHWKDIADLWIEQRNDTVAVSIIKDRINALSEEVEKYI
jgi:hypothetical protein